MSSRRPPRDPGAPKRNMSAYLLYQNAMRDTFKQQNPGMTFGQLSKFTSAMYAEMPADEKEVWNQRAEADKARFLHELSSYVPPPGYDVKGDATTPLVSHVSTKRRSGGITSAIKTTRDPNAPKRNMSAYLLYQNCMREQFKAHNPGMTFGQLAKYTSYMYKCLTAEEKQRWEAHAAQDKARYEAEMQNYTPPPGFDSTGNLVEDRRLNKKYMKKNKDPEQPKRARGSFVFFTFDMRPKVMAEYPGIKFVDMGVILGERWRALPADDKQKYEDMAHEDKMRFNREMEEYSATRLVNEPPAPAAAASHMADSRNHAAAAAAYNHQMAAQAHAALHQAAAHHAGYHPDMHAAAPQHYDQHAYYADPSAQYYADPNAVAPHDDPYGQLYYQPAGQQYHYG